MGFGSLIGTLFHLRLMIIALFWSFLAVCLGRRCSDLLLSWVCLQPLSLHLWCRTTGSGCGADPPAWAGRGKAPQGHRPLLPTCPRLTRCVISGWSSAFSTFDSSRARACSVCWFYYSAPRAISDMCPGIVAYPQYQMLMIFFALSLTSVLFQLDFLFICLDFA